jgi:hypothetical protein
MAMVSLCYRVSHPYQIRRKTTYTLKLFFVFLFLSLIFLPLPQAITQALPFKAIKGEAGTLSRGINGETAWSTHQSSKQPTLETYTLETWELLPLSKYL